MFARKLILALVLIGGNPAQSADFIFDDDVIIQGPDNVTDLPARLCVGADCSNGEVFTSGFDSVIKMDGKNNMIEFIDGSATSDPDRDWRIRINESSGGNAGEGFFIEDLTSSTTPFHIQGAVPDNTLVLHSNGSVGIGTHIVMEGAALNIVQPSDSRILLESTGPSKQGWELTGNQNFFWIGDYTLQNFPFYIQKAAPTGALVIEDTGDIGLGTSSPEAPLHLEREESFNFFRISATGAAVNESVDITFTGGPLGTGQLRYNIVDGDNQEMSLDANGNMVLDGTLTTAGPTCAGGCDRVFDADYALPSIEEHASEMFAAGHLPSIGATIPHAPVNLSERQGRIINSLEHAHIYIDQLHDQLRAQDDVNAELLERLARLEAIVAQN